MLDASRILAVTSALLMAGGMAAAQPTPDCARAGTAAERAICSDPALKAADAKMANTTSR
jgi:uncharacterized protein